ncbi:hypothetical protein [Streptomyces sp. NPDC051909]
MGDMKRVNRQWIWITVGLTALLLLVGVRVRYEGGNTALVRITAYDS